MSQIPNSNLWNRPLTAAECRTICKDRKTAEKNGTFRDSDKNGISTEAEYLQQGSSLDKRKQLSNSGDTKGAKGPGGFAQLQWQECGSYVCTFADLAPGFSQERDT
jgi:hypothetical protein